MSNLKLTGQEQYILKLALNSFKIEIEKSEFQPNSIFTKEFVLFSNNFFILLLQVGQL